jgi:7tm Odorant receptor
MQKLLFFPMMFQLLLFVIMIILWLFEVALVDDYLSSTFSIRLNLMFAVTMEMYTACYCGESIIHESQAISGKIYRSKWYQLVYSSHNRKDLKQLKHILTLTMMRANRPIKISAGGFMTINFETFMMVRRKSRKG